MTDTIIVDYDPFAMESRVVICRESRREQVSVFSSVETLVHELTNLAYSNNIYSIKINGPFSIASELKQLVGKYEKSQYSENKIEVGNI